MLIADQASERASESLPYCDNPFNASRIYELINKEIKILPVNQEELQRGISCHLPTQ